MDYVIFLKHCTGETAVIHSVGESTQDVLEGFSTSLGEGWEATGAMERKPEIPKAIHPDEPKLRFVRFPDPPPPTKEVEDRARIWFGEADVLTRATPKYALFNVAELCSCQYNAMPGNYVYLYRSTVILAKDWFYFEWGYQGPHGTVKNVLDDIAKSKSSDLIYAVYERVVPTPSPGLFRLIATKST